MTDWLTLTKLRDIAQRYTSSYYAARRSDSTIELLTKFYSNFKLVTKYHFLNLNYWLLELKIAYDMDRPQATEERLLVVHLKILSLRLLIQIQPF